MAKLNVIKAIEKTKGRINERYGMYSKDISDIKEYSNGDIILFSVNSFKFGYAQGHKAAVAEMRKNAKA